MEKSVNDILKDWDVVSSADLNGQKNNFHTENKNDTIASTENVTVSNTASSSSRETENVNQQGSGVQNVHEESYDENVGHESSSSDIDIIDENVDDNVTGCILIPSSLSVSSSIGGSSSVITTQSENDKTEFEETFKSCPNKSAKKSTSEDDDNSREYSSEDRNEDDIDLGFDWTIGGRPLHEWFTLFLEFIQNMSGLQWSIVFGVTLCVYVCITINQTNIIALEEKGNVVSQMKKMMDELRYDNKILRDQMLSEMKNEKVLSSFEHQIKELRKENSKLNHMLHDVTKVLERQKDSQEKLFEKKEAEYLASFKKEINKLKEHINILKFDNEELQKQLVRMRYASYSQGEKHSEDTKNKGFTKTEKDEKHEERPEEIPVDIQYLKKWNELISLLSKELGALFNEKETPAPEEKKSHTESETKISWDWKNLKTNLKGTLNSFPNINISDMLSKYSKMKEKTMSKIYKSVSDFFQATEESPRKVDDPLPSEEEKSEWKNMWDFVNVLEERWSKMKNKFFKSGLKDKGFKTFEQHQANPKSEQNNNENTDFHFQSSDKHDKVQGSAEDSEWMFNRAAHRAQLRDTEEETSVNWFLRKSKHPSQHEANTEDTKFEYPSAKKWKHIKQEL